MDAEGVDVLFLAPSADLEYLTGVERQVPNFGGASYANGWIADHLLIEQELVTGLTWVVPHGDVLPTSLRIADAALHPVEASPPV
jgi:hypothetical protein